MEGQFSRICRAMTSCSRGASTEAVVPTPKKAPPSAALATASLPTLAFRASFYFYCSVPGDGEVTSLNAIGSRVQDGAIAFATTRWTVVLQAQGDSPAAQQALEK